MAQKGGCGIARVLVWLVCLGCLVGCKNAGSAQVPLTRVRTVTAEIVDFAPSITLTGVVAAVVSTDLSFRVGGKIVERLVNVGDHVVKGQVLARLDPEEQQAELASAEAGVGSGDAMLRQTTAAFERQKALLTRGNTTRRDYDQAEAALRSARAQLDQAHADLKLAQDQLSYTVLRADADGIITAQVAEVGQVVAQAQLIYTLARDGPRDAVFNVHECPSVFRTFRAVLTTTDLLLPGGHFWCSSVSQCSVTSQLEAGTLAGIRFCTRRCLLGLSAHRCPDTECQAEGEAVPPQCRPWAEA